MSDQRGHVQDDDQHRDLDAATAVQNAHEWFEHNSGWAPPDADTLAEWIADDFCRAPDECATTPDGWCPHGLASWALILAALDTAPD